MTVVTAKGLMFVFINEVIKSIFL